MTQLRGEREENGLYCEDWTVKSRVQNKALNMTGNRGRAIKGNVIDRLHRHAKF